MAPPDRSASPAVDAVTRALLRAHRERRRCSSLDPAFALRDDVEAMAVQDAVCAALAGTDEVRTVAWKAGASGPGAPVSACPLPVAGLHHGATRLPGTAFHQRGVEAEIAFRLARPPECPASDDEVLPCFDALCVAIEVVDSRWIEAMAATERLRLADLQSHAALVLGDWLPLRPIDWATQACRVLVNGEPAARGVGTHSCVDPGRVLGGWLRHAAARGAALQAGDVVTTGSWGRALWVGPDDHVLVDFPGLGKLRLAFEPG
ncbi:fumarylacetoacetate hydrolase family protein [uncultured Methylibium sp.]|uniref:fumarylacetoacetate hydrolase family protein n=1 Tax=uncultured Methylibium sp. TaxID=381093 RepID=UPI0025DF177E|nr:fumarylacetoacetate hydrolase family protein [uncultured Methylibium sp.]